MSSDPTEVLMRHKILMVGRVEPENEKEIGEVFAEHDATELPRLIGARRRVLYSFRGLYIHLVESDVDFRQNLFVNRAHPIFQRTNERMASLVAPYDPDHPGMREAEAAPFYEWSAE
jgi:cyclase